MLKHGKIYGSHCKKNYTASFWEMKLISHLTKPIKN